MGSGGGSDGEDELPSTASAKKVKLHKKILEDSNAVDHASIPRKLRSVNRKRTFHFVSLPLPNPKRINRVNGLRTARKDYLKKSKSGWFISESMSKDEEEVAEALYALAGTVPGKMMTSLSNKSDGESPSKKQMDSKKLEEDSMLSSQGASVPEDNCNPTSEELSEQKAKVDDLGKSTLFSQPKLSEAIQPNQNSSPFALHLNHQSLGKISSGNKSNSFEQKEAHLSQRISGDAGDLGSQDKQKHALIESKENGSTLLPSLYPHQASHGSGSNDGFPSQLLVTELPYWLNNAAASSKPGIHQSQVSQKDDSEVKTRIGKIRSRCATHIYISHFVQSSQNLEGKEIPFLEAHQFRPTKDITLGVLKASSHPNPASNGPAMMMPDSHTCRSFSEKTFLEASNDNTLTTPRSLTQGRLEQTSLAPGNSTLRRQCFDFLSLSSGGSKTEPKVDANRNEIHLDPLADLSVPQLQSLRRYESAASLPFPPHLLLPNPYQNQLSTSAQPQPPVPRVHLQPPPYYSKRIQLGSNASSMTKQPQVHPRQPQQHSIWTPQLAAQYRPRTLAPSQIAYWRNSRQESQIVQYAQAQMPPSQPSQHLEAHFPKYLQMPQHYHHQMPRISSPFPPIKATTHHGPVPIGCNVRGG